MDLNDLLKNPDQIKTLISVLQTLVDSTEGQTDHSEDEPKPKKTKERTKGTTASIKKTKQSSGRENKFLSMPEKNLHKEDIEIDRKLHKLPPTPRSRKFNSIRVTCRVCGKTESINPSYMTTERDRYKCNKCSGAAG